MGYIRKASKEFRLIDDGDKIAVGVSGGKDSLVLLSGLARMRNFYPNGYEIKAVTIDPRFNGKDSDYTSVERLCETLGVEYSIVRTDIGSIVFDIRKESNPCSLCARLRRGALNNEAERLGCSKLALGHNNDDAIETFMMNLFYEGRVGCFSPKTFLPDKKITVIRPLVLAPEYAVISCAKHNGLDVIKSECPVDKKTMRQNMKVFLNQLEHKNHGVKQRIFTALRGADENWKTIK